VKKAVFMAPTLPIIQEGSQDEETFVKTGDIGEFGSFALGKPRILGYNKLVVS